jgi:hypothetical protein
LVYTGFDYWFFWFGPVKENGCPRVNNFASWETNQKPTARKPLKMLELKAAGDRA